MADYEYKTVALPGLAARRRKRRRESMEDAAALDLEVLLNEHGVDGWVFWSLETISTRPARGMFGGKEPHPVSLVIFRRLREGVELVTSGMRAAPQRQEPPAPSAPRLGGALE